MKSHRFVTHHRHRTRVPGPYHGFHPFVNPFHLYSACLAANCAAFLRFWGRCHLGQRATGMINSPNTKHTRKGCKRVLWGNCKGLDYNDRSQSSLIILVCAAKRMQGLSTCGPIWIVVILKLLSSSQRSISSCTTVLTFHGRLFSTVFTCTCRVLYIISR